MPGKLKSPHFKVLSGGFTLTWPSCNNKQLRNLYAFLETSLEKQQIDKQYVYLGSLKQNYNILNRVFKSWCAIAENKLFVLVSYQLDTYLRIIIT